MSRDLIETGLGWSYTPQRIMRLMNDAETIALVARDVRQPVGFAVMTFGDERSHLVLLAVTPSHQRRGIASRMLEWLEETALTAGMASMHVELRADNEQAFALYRVMGFAETFRVPGYYRGRETAVKMIRTLRHPGRSV